MGLFIKQSEGEGAPVTMKNSGNVMVLCMFWWLLKAKVISNPMHKNFVNFSRHIEYTLHFLGHKWYGQQISQ